MKIPVHPEAMDIIDIPMIFDNDHLLGGFNLPL